MISMVIDRDSRIQTLAPVAAAFSFMPLWLVASEYDGTALQKVIGIFSCYANAIPCLKTKLPMSRGPGDNNAPHVISTFGQTI